VSDCSTLVMWSWKRVFCRLVLVGILCGLISLFASFDCTQASAEVAGSHFVKGPGQKKLIIFVHGLLGGPESTWTNPENGASWPRLIAADPELKGYDVYVYGYMSPAYGPASNVNELASRFGQQLKDEKIFSNYDDISFITHSMGGIVTKRMLNMLNTPSQVQLLKKVRCVLYISVPSNGANLAALASWLSYNPQFKSILPRGAADFLQSVESDWATMLNDRTSLSPFPRTFSAYETLPTRGFRVVSELYISHRSDAPIQPFDYDHFSIVKPRDRNSEVYVWAKSRILESSALKQEGLSHPKEQRADKHLPPLVKEAAVSTVIPFNKDGLRPGIIYGKYADKELSQTFMALADIGRIPSQYSYTFGRPEPVLDNTAEPFTADVLRYFILRSIVELQNSQTISSYHSEKGFSSVTTTAVPVPDPQKYPSNQLTDLLTETKFGLEPLEQTIIWKRLELQVPVGTKINISRNSITLRKDGYFTLRFEIKSAGQNLGVLPVGFVPEVLAGEKLDQVNVATYMFAVEMRFEWQRDYAEAEPYKEWAQGLFDGLTKRLKQPSL